MQPGTITLADFTGLLTGLGVAVSPARRLGSTYAAAVQGGAALDRIFMLFDAQNTIVDGPAHASGRSVGRIGFEARAISPIPMATSALDGVTLAIQPGLARRLRRPLGRRQVDGVQPAAAALRPDRRADHARRHDIRDLTLAILRDQIAVVSQDLVLLSGTVAQNIGFGRRDAAGPRSRRRRRRRPPTASSARCPRATTRRIGHAASLLRRRAPAAVDRAGHPARRADPAARRADLGARRRERGADPRRARPARARPHHAGDRASADDDPATPT